MEGLGELKLAGTIKFPLANRWIKVKENKRNLLGRETS